jgi:hypothetical protein
MPYGGAVSGEHPSTTRCHILAEALAPLSHPRIPL